MMKQRLFRYLNQPYKILFWTIDEALLLIIGIVSGVTMSSATLLIVTFILYFVLRRVKAAIGAINYRVLCFEYMGIAPRSLKKKLVPSHIKQIRG
jgi:type IV conjugative transfer system protein TraL